LADIDGALYTCIFTKSTQLKLNYKKYTAFNLIGYTRLSLELL